MTTIAYNNGLMASDTKITAGSMYERIESKIFQQHGLTIGASGTLAVLNRMVINGVPKPKKKQSFDSYVLNELLPYARAMKKEAHGGESEGDWDHDSQLLVASSDRVAVVGLADGSVVSGCADEYFSIGSGAPFALAAMYLHQSADEAVRVAMQFDIGTGGNVVSLATNEIK